MSPTPAPADTPAPAPYVERRAARSLFIEVRGLRLHLRCWGDRSLTGPGRPTLVALHGWMDVAASFQFMVDALAAERHVVALDWRGFGLSEPSGADAYWFPDYLGDLDAVLDALAVRGDIDGPVDLLGHSMGGNVVMLYAGIRPARIRRLLNLEGFGQPGSTGAQAPARYARWLDELKTPQTMRRYDSADAVADRLRQTNPHLPVERARWLAPHWARQASDGRWDILGDPAHKRVNPVLYRVEEALACWQAITAPVLWVEGARTRMSQFWGERYGREEFEQRLAAVRDLRRVTLADAGHMLHHDQPEALARAVEGFLDAGSP
jgi:pimeloyl-ACP methyl ester carboxylesterase